MTASTDTPPPSFESAESFESTPPSLEYRPALDGLRAVAVYLVLAFHAGIARFTGGFIGVDLFFVLSGYLVTRVILTDLHRSTFTLSGFYGRRVRRLLPAALVTLVGVSLLWLFIASPVDRLIVLGDARSAALYFSNWHFAHTATDYFAANDNPTPLLHFWSLSVEEQFYVVWPLTMIGLWVASGRRHRRAARYIAVAAAVGIALSLVALVLTLRSGNTALAYYGTHTRAYQLLSGALLAVGVHHWKGASDRLRRWAAPIQGAALVALVVLGTNWVSLGPSNRGVVAAIVSVLLIASIEIDPLAPPSRVLGVSPLTYLGKISYATYLWHYPTLVVIRRFASVPPTLLFVVAAIVATGIAALSNQLLEMPIRTSKLLGRHSSAVVACGLAFSLIAGLVVIPIVLRNDRLPLVSATGTASGGGLGAPPVVMAGIDLKKAGQIPAGSPAIGLSVPDPNCATVSLDRCILVHGTHKKILLLGDSHAEMLSPALITIAKEEHDTLLEAYKSGCPWQLTLVFTRSDPKCPQVRDHWYHTVIPTFAPDIIILATRATDHPAGTGYPVRSTDPSIPKDQSGMIAETTRRSLLALAAPGRILVLIEAVPVGPVNTTSCLSGARLSSECAFVADATSAADLSFRSFATTMPDVRSIDIDPLVCPYLPTCDPIVDGVLVRVDHDHISFAWSAHMAEDLRRLLHAAHAL